MDASGQQALRTAKSLKLSFIVAGAMFVFVVIKIPAQPKTAPSAVMELAIGVMALINVMVGFFVPSLITLPASSSLLDNSGSVPVKRWFSRCIVSLACFSACNLFAVVLHFLGARVWIVELVFAIGMLSLIFWSPGTPPGREQNMITQN